MREWTLGFKLNIGSIGIVLVPLLIIGVFTVLKSGSSL